MIPEMFLKESDEFRKWRKEENVTNKEMLEVLINILRCYHAIRFQQMKEEVEQLRRHLESLTPKAKLAEAEKLSQKEEQKQKNIQDEIKRLEEIKSDVVKTLEETGFGQNDA